MGHLITKEVGILEVTTTTTTGGGEDPYGSGGDPYGGMYSGGMYPGGMPGYGGGSTTTTTSDVNQPEYALYRWEYYPAGHPSAGLLKTEFDPLWDGSSADTHRTDLEYNIFGNLTKKLGPASVTGQTRPETVYTYDAFSRLHTVVDPEGHTVEYQYDASGRRIRTIYDDSTTEETLYGAAGSGNEGLVVKTKDRRNVVSTMSYDAAGRVIQTITGSAFDANILDGQPDDSPITDRNQKSIVQMGYEPGSQTPAVVIRDGARTDRIFDYRGRVVETRSYPYAGKTLVSKTKYLNNRKLYDEDPYGRRKYQAYRASDGVMVRHVVEAHPGVVDAVMAANDNTPQYTAGYNAGYNVGYEDGFFGGYMYYYGYGNTPSPNGTAAYVEGYLDAHGDGLSDGFADAMDEMYGGMYGGSGGSGPVGYHGNYWMDSHGRSFSVPPVEQNAVLMALMRDTNLNPNYTVKDAIQDPGGRVWQVVDERSTLTETTFDTRGQAVIQLAAKGTPVEAKTETIFDAAGNAVEIRSPRYFDVNDLNGFEKCRTVMTYDGANRVLTRTEAPGTAEVGTESYTYDLSGRQKSRVDARGKEWTTTYASCCGHSVSSKNPLGHGSITNQNAGGLTVHTAGVEDVAGHNSLLNPDDAKTLQETTTKYDALGRSIASTVWLQPLGLVDVANPPIAGFGGVAGTQGLTTQTLYDANLTDNSGLETTTGITVTNPLGGTYTVSLAAAITKLGQPIAQGGAGITFAAGTPGKAVVNINAENEISFSISDAQGRSLMSGIVARPSGAGTSSELRTWSCNVPDTTETINSKVYLTSLSVDALGNTTKSRSNGLGHTVQSVDQAGNISTVQNDAGGNAIIIRDPNNVGQDCVYDALGRRTQCTDTVGSVTKTGYDKSGQQISATDAKNKTTYYVFDAQGRKRRETDRLNYPTEWSYDAAGNLLSLKDAENQITSYTYNDAGQRVTEQYPDHVAGATIGTTGYGIITFGYDALGRRTSKQDQQGDVTSYNFDMSGRMLTRGYVGHASGPLAGQTNTDTFTYDRAGRMLSGVKGRYNNTVTFSYDDRGQQTQETLTTHGQTYTVGYQKNVLGQTTRLVYPDGSLVDRAYTNRGQLQAVNYTPLNGALSSVATFTYDAGGRETQRNLGNGLTTTRSYFADNQIQSIATPTVETLTYTYDANKNPTSESRSGVMAPYSWSTGPTGYDHEDRLTNWSRTNGDSQTWNLSPVHDWNSTTINGAVQTRSHGPAHELLTMSGAQVTSSPRTLTYDPKGNMTTDDRGCGMIWDFDNMMQSFAGNGVTDLKNATYEYDAIGRRCATSIVELGEEVETAILVNSGVSELCEFSPSSIATILSTSIYADDIDDLLSYREHGVTSSELRWVHLDRRRTPLSVIDSVGVVEEYYAYTSHGECRILSPLGYPLDRQSSQLRVHKRGYTGRGADVESSQINFRTRSFSSSVGRFTGRDFAKYLEGGSLYNAYFVPRGVDPFGLACLEISRNPVAANRHAGGSQIAWGFVQWETWISLGMKVRECDHCCPDGKTNKKIRSISISGLMGGSVSIGIGKHINQNWHEFQVFGYIGIKGTISGTAAIEGSFIEDECVPGCKSIQLCGTGTIEGRISGGGSVWFSYKNRWNFDVAAEVYVTLRKPYSACVAYNTCTGFSFSPPRWGRTELAVGVRACFGPCVNPEWDLSHLLPEWM